MQAGKGGEMKKVIRLLPELEFKYQFGNKGIFPVKGIPKTIGVSEEGRRWFSLLRCRRVSKDDGIPMRGYHYIEEIFSFDRIVEGKEVLEKYFEGLENK
jgi:hypothetical protein